LENERALKKTLFFGQWSLARESTEQERKCRQRENLPQDVPEDVSGTTTDKGACSTRWFHKKPVNIGDFSREARNGRKADARG